MRRGGEIPSEEHSPARLGSLPLLTLHLTERCNSRCVSCDYWRHGRADLGVERIGQLLPELRELGTHTILLSGGEPLIHPQWAEIAELLHAEGMRLWLVTSGLSLLKHAQAIARLFENVTVSLDGIDREMYLRIRGVNAFDKVCAGVRAIAALGVCVSIRVTVQRDNFYALPEFVDLAHGLGASEISFLAADIGNANAFGRSGEFQKDIALAPDDLSRFARVLATLSECHAEAFRTGFIAESPAKLRRLLDYFAALNGLGAFPPTRCNAPEFSAVIGSDGSLKPCFFIPGATEANIARGIRSSLNSDPMIELRRAIRSKQRSECATCVCSLWREESESRVPGLRSNRTRAEAIACSER